MKKAPWHINAVVYALDVEYFRDSDGDGIGDFIGVTTQLSYLKKLGVTCIWLLPFFHTTNHDNGYDVSNHIDIDTRLGTLEDFHEFVMEAHRHGIKVIIDLVYHHTSVNHPWFQVGRVDKTSPYHDYYVWSETLPDIGENSPTNKPAMAGEQKTVWTYDRVAKAYYYHRFYDYEPDLNLRNPHVQEEIIRIMEFWLSFGIDGFRVDAATMFFEKKGIDDTQMLHPGAFLERMRSVVTEKNPDGILVAEADVTADLFIHFVKNHRFDLLCNFYMNAHLFQSLAEQTHAGIYQQIDQQYQAPEHVEWLNFLRNLDELNLEKLSIATRNNIYDSFAPARDMRAYHRGIRRRLAPMLNGDTARLKMAFSLLCALPGALMISYGDEIGMGENLSLQYRNAVRTPMQWNDGKNGGFSHADESKLVRNVIETGPFSKEYINVDAQLADRKSLLHMVQRLIRLRKKYMLRTSHCTYEKIHKHIVAISYREKKRVLHLLHNMSQQELSINFDTHGMKKLIESTQRISITKSTITFPPYGFIWLEK